MPSWLLAFCLSATSPPGSHLVEGSGVRVLTSLESSAYTWEVTNQGAAPIVSFEIPAHNMYAPTVPAGWQHNQVDLEDVFRAWTDDQRHAIGPGRPQTFTAKVTVAEAVLGLVPMTLRTSEGAALRIDGVWGAAPKPRAPVVLVTLMLVGIGCLHAAIIAGRERQARGPAPR